MKTRIIAGSVFVVVLAVTFFLAPMAVTAITMGAMVALASYELLFTTGLVRNIRLNVYSALMAVGIVVWSYLDGGFAPMYCSDAFTYPTDEGCATWIAVLKAYEY